MLSAFLFGALSFVSPCVLPLLPGYLSLMSGYSVADLQEGKAGVGRMFAATLLFVAGFTVVFMAAGASATSLGGFLTRNRSLTQAISGWLIVIFGLIIILLAVSTSQRLSFLARERRLEVRPSRLGGWAPPVMGMAFGFGWTPCIGPVLGAILTLAASQDTVWRGVWLLFVYSMGLGIPFVLAGVGMTRLYSGIKFIQRYLRPINIVSGALMIGFGALFITDNISLLSNWISDFLIWIGLEGLTVI